MFHVEQISEAALTRALVQWLRLGKDGRQHTIHIPNEGKRSVRVAAKLKSEGMRKGVSDLFIPVAAGGWHGLWLELKAKGKKPTPEQSQFMVDMTRCGYCCVCADTLDDAMLAVNAYCNGEWRRPNHVYYSAPAKVR